MAAFFRADLILDHHRGGAGTGIFDDRALHVQGIAVAGIAVADQRNFARGGTAVAHAVQHLAKRNEAGIRHAEPCGGDGKAAHEGDFESSRGDKLGRERVEAPRHDGDRRFGKKLSQSLGC